MFHVEMPFPVCPARINGDYVMPLAVAIVAVVCRMVVSPVREHEAACAVQANDTGLGTNIKFAVPPVAQDAVVRRTGGDLEPQGHGVGRAAAWEHDRIGGPTPEPHACGRIDLQHSPAHGILHDRCHSGFFLRRQRKAVAARVASRFRRIVEQPLRHQPADLSRGKG